MHRPHPPLPSLGEETETESGEASRQAPSERGGHAHVPSKEGPRCRATLELLARAMHTGPAAHLLPASIFSTGAGRGPPCRRHRSTCRRDEPRPHFPDVACGAWHARCLLAWPLAAAARRLARETRCRSAWLAAGLHPSPSGAKVGIGGEVG
jgi:hypothetical protein